MTDEEPRYAAGFRTQTSEVSDVACDVAGDLPDWLSGTLVRNGPGTFEAGDRRLNHWFDGYAMLHAFAIDGSGGEGDVDGAGEAGGGGDGSGTVTYSNRSLHSDAYTHATEEGEMGYAEFATDPCRDLFERFFAIFDPDVTDNASVNVSQLADDHVAMTETPMPVEFDPETLETVGVREDTVPDGHVTTAHPHHDPERGVVNYVTRLRPFSHTYRVYAVPEDSGEGETAVAAPDGGAAEPEVLAEVPVDKPRYMHSFGMTERYVVLAEFPLTVSLWSLALSGGGPFIEAYDWEPERGTRFTVIDKDTGDVVARPVGEPFFAFHHVNAFERTRDGGEGDDGGDAAGDGEAGADEIVVDVAAYDDAEVIDALYLDELMTAESALPGGELRRYRVPLDGDGDARGGDGDAPPGDAGEWDVARETVYGGTVELPRINYPERNGRDYRYVYGVGNRASPPEDFPNRLLKVDVEAGEAAVWEEEGAYPGEPVFVAAPTAAADGGAGSAAGDAAADGGEAAVRAEDDGVVLSVVLDAESESSYLLCLDADTFEERARAAVPQAVPFGFHGQFWR